jgi:hypothetical protein
LQPSPPAADSSCWLIVMVLMLITTSGDGVIGTLYDLLFGMMNIVIVDTNAEHEYLLLFLYIMERSDNDVSEEAEG